jgi:hypothetical protein
MEGLVRCKLVVVSGGYLQYVSVRVIVLIDHFFRIGFGRVNLCSSCVVDLGMLGAGGRA